MIKLTSAARRPATIKDIAAHAGVSISTVHYALRRTRPISAETRERVMQAVAALDYQPHAGAATLPSGRTGRLAVVIGGIDPAFANTYFSDFIRGLAAAAEEQDHTVVLYTAYGRRAAVGWRPAHVLRRREADGLLLLGTQISEAHLEEVADLGKPCVVLNREHAALPCVIADREQGTRLATEHLLRAGRRPVGLLSAAYRGGLPLEARPERLGYAAACRAAGLDVDPDLIRFAPVGTNDEAETSLLVQRLMARDCEFGSTALLNGHSNGSLAFGAAASRDSLIGDSEERKPGLVVFSYTLAPAAGRSISRSGVRVPEELALVVGDEDPDAREMLDAPATAVVAPKFEMAQAAAQLLLKLVRGDAVAQAERLQRFEMELRVRWSCGARTRTA
jgi:DNA-binding LacI/PurR family transcriptional regulator